MSKKDWFEAWLRTRQGDITVKFDSSGIAWAGFWIGLGIYLAAGVMSGQIHIPDWIKP